MNEHSEKLLEQAEYLTEIERWNEAIPLLSKVLAQNPEHFQANCLLALCHYSLKDHETALRFAEKAVAVAPDEEWGHRLRSVVLSEQGRKKEALQAAAEAVRVEPFEPFALQVLANAYLSNNKPRKAEEIVRKMLEIEPESENSFFTLGNVHLHRGNNYEAEKCFRDALRINPHCADARNNLGVALLRQQETKPELFNASNLSLFQTEDEIQRHFTEAVKLEPGNRIAAENLRNQFDYFVVFFGFPVFIPFLLIAFFVVPGMTIFVLFMGIILFIQMLWEVRRRRRKLTPEMKMFLRSSHKNLFDRIKEFLETAQNIFKKTWKPHLLAIFAVIVRNTNFFVPKEYKTDWSSAVALILIIASAVWLISELRKH